MKQKKPALPILLLIGAFVLAFGFRLVRLGYSPLDDREADIALQALAVAENSETEFGDFMSIVGLTGLDFYLFSSTNFLARFWSAFIGALIVFIPVLFREKLGHVPALISAYLLAITPEMVGLSRLVGTPMTAMVCLLLSLGFLVNRKPIFVGIFFALGLMSGTGFWMGLIILGISWLITKRLTPKSDLHSLFHFFSEKSFWLHFGAAFGLTLLIISTSFFLEPAGLSGVMSGLVTFVLGYGHEYLDPYYLLPLSLLAYTVPALVFGVWSGIRGLIARDKIDTFLFVWFIVSLAFILIYPGSQPEYLPWMTVSLWLLTARFLFRSIRFPEKPRLVVIATVVAVIVLAGFMLIAVRTVVRLDLEQQHQTNALIALIGGLALVIIVFLLVYFGWGGEVAISGLVIWLVIVNVLGLISLTVNTTTLGSKDAENLWYPDQPQLSTEWLMLSIDRISDWNKGGGEPVDIEVSDFEVPGLEWALRGFVEVNFVPYLSPQSQSGIVITDDRSHPELVNSYRGEDLIWSQKSLWKEMTPMQYINWLVTRNTPTQKEQIILWVRTDLMVDDQLSQ